ncbi:MAG TPA: hypothetical protein PLI77_04755 [Bacteroidales bacterium]|jgi:hypothetical protein|nr:hypothetical protein [Bacteroidales bacterium]HPE40381.1 hypothetical protein [Bacteroidales bacterium]
MKKVVLSILVVAIAAFLFSSCNKVCNCTVQSNNVTLEGYDNLPVGEMSEDECTAYSDATWDNLGYTYTCVSE